jgi:hypothetical protein
MSIGASVFLIAVGAILAFALKVEIGWLDLRIVGYVLMGAAVIGLVSSMMLRRRRAHAAAEHSLSDTDN